MVYEISQSHRGGFTMSEEFDLSEKMKLHICLRCDYQWIGRTEKPLCCPRCHSRNWKIKPSIIKTLKGGKK